jgi:hypothetical protein
MLQNKYPQDLQGDGSLLQPQHISVSSKATSLLIGCSLHYKLHDQRKVTNQERIGVSQVIYMNHSFVSNFGLLKVIAASKYWQATENRRYTGLRQCLWWRRRKDGPLIHLPDQQHLHRLRISNKYCNQNVVLVKNKTKMWLYNANDCNSRHWITYAHCHKAPLRCSLLSSRSL